MPFFLILKIKIFIYFVWVDHHMDNEDRLLAQKFVDAITEIRDILKVVGQDLHDIQKEIRNIRQLLK